ncbi:MAG: ABC transporter ATP-binding protein [Candidatus Latescibacteria bacterium]|nr:ABC transporter ATP-binding protein [Candidatus Latescibacterota bacterium]
MNPALAFSQVNKTYALAGNGSRYALREVCFAVAAGQKIAIVGRSGSGKSTLLHLAAGIDVPTTGEVWVEGRELGRLSEGERTLFRRHEVGLIFQFFHLLSHLSVGDNVALPAMIAGEHGEAAEARVVELLERVGLADRRRDPVQQLSGGEMQRVAICRALLRRPRLLLADEPTGNLDDENGRRVMDLLLSLADDEGAALLFVTHSQEFARLADQVWELHSGELVAGTEG